MNLLPLPIGLQGQLVRQEGLEPPRLAALDPKSSVSAISPLTQIGVLEESRTPNLQIRSLVLCPVELREQNWMPELDLNQHKLNQNQLSYH